MSKDVMLTIRLPEALRDRYQSALKSEDLSASQHLRGVISAFCDAAEAQYGAVICESERFEKWTGRGRDHDFFKARAIKRKSKHSPPTIRFSLWNNYTGEDASVHEFPFKGDESYLKNWIESASEDKLKQCFDVAMGRWQKETNEGEAAGDPPWIEELP